MFHTYFDKEPHFLQSHLNSHPFIVTTFTESMLKRICTVFGMFFSGLCMVYVEEKNILNHYNCGMFKEGCPNTVYYSDEMYKCAYYPLFVSIIHVSDLVIIHVIVTYSCLKKATYITHFNSETVPKRLFHT